MLLAAKLQEGDLFCIFSTFWGQIYAMVIKKFTKYEIVSQNHGRMMAKNLRNINLVKIERKKKTRNYDKMSRYALQSAIFLKCETR